VRRVSRVRGARLPPGDVAEISVADARIAGRPEAEAKAKGICDAAIVRVGDRWLRARSEVEVLPGVHTVEVEWTMHEPAPARGGHAGTGHVVVPLDSHAGRHYRLVWDRMPYEHVGTAGHDESIPAPGGPVAHFEEGR
jgi:hypothetical protein